MSTEQIADIEDQITAKIGELKSATTKQKIIANLFAFRRTKQKNQNFEII